MRCRATRTSVVNDLDFARCEFIWTARAHGGMSRMLGFESLRGVDNNPTSNRGAIIRSVRPTLRYGVNACKSYMLQIPLIPARHDAGFTVVTISHHSKDPNCLTNHVEVGRSSLSAPSTSSPMPTSRSSPSSPNKVSWATNVLIM